MAGRDHGFFNNYLDNVHEVDVIAIGDCIIHLIAMQEGVAVSAHCVEAHFARSQILYLTKLHLAHAGVGSWTDREKR
jgi:hypothetical protein